MNKKNKNTDKCGLVFNVNNTKKWMKKYFERVYEDTNTIKVSNAHFTLSATDEILCIKFSLYACKRAVDSEPVNGLYELTLNNIRDSIRLNADLNYTFERLLCKYDNGQDYLSEMNIKKQEIIEFIEKYAFNGSNINIGKDALNFIMFIMLQNRIMLMNTIYNLVNYKKSKTISENAIAYAVQINYINELSKDLVRKVNEVTQIVKDKKNTEKPDIEVDIEIIQE